MNHQCPFCKIELAFYKIKESEKYEWYSCAKCGFKRRVKKEKQEISVNNLFGENV